MTIVIDKNLLCCLEIFLNYADFMIFCLLSTFLQKKDAVAYDMFAGKYKRIMLPSLQGFYRTRPRMVNIFMLYQNSKKNLGDIFLILTNA